MKPNFTNEGETIMYSFKKSLIAFAGLFVLLGLIALVTPRTSVGQKNTAPQDVRLVGTTVTQPVSASSPLPVTGSVGINGTPTVGLAAGSSVAINGTPVVGLDAGNNTVKFDAVNNTVKIDTANPLPVRDADNPARQPFQAHGSNTFVDGGRVISAVTITTVPAGKRLIIEHVSVFGVMLAGQKMIETAITTRLQNSNSGQPLPHDLTINAQGSNGFRDYFVASQDMRWYADAGTDVVGFAERDNTAGGGGDVQFAISGYFVDVP